jgi:hydrogenase maturation factor
MEDVHDVLHLEMESIQEARQEIELDLEEQAKVKHICGCYYDCRTKMTLLRILVRNLNLRLRPSSR